MLDWNINWLAVIVSGLAAFLIGTLWYSKALFGNAWMRLSKIKPGSSGMAGGITLALISYLVMALALALFVNASGASSFLEGVYIGFWAWLGFVAVTSLGVVLWEGKPWALYFLNNGYHLLILLLMGGVLAAW